MHRKTGTARSQIAHQVRRQRRRAFVWSDVVAPFTVAVLWFVLPFGASLTVRFVGFGLVAGIATIDRVLRPTLPLEWSNFVLVGARVAVAIVLGSLVEVMFYPAAVVITGLCVGAILVEPRWRIVVATSVGLGGLVFAALLHDIERWWLTTTIFVIVVAATETWAREWNEERNEVERRHNEMVDRASMFSWEIDKRSGQIVALAGSVEEVIGWRAEDLIGEHASAIVPLEVMRREADEPGPSADEQRVVELRHRDGHTVTLREVRLSGDEYTSRGVSADISELASATEALRHQAEHDALTGLANRKLLESTMVEALEAGHQPALIVADLDRFKEINDTLGHPIGDEVLRLLSQRFASSLEGVDLVARIGGDEFAFVIANNPDRHVAERVARAVYELAISAVTIEAYRLAVSCSVGIALAPEHGTVYADLLKHADIATYQAKRGGGGVVVYETTPDEMSVQRLRLISEVSGAIDRHEFELFVQPQVDLATGVVVGVEGLARWRHPEFGVLAPGAFLSTIEVAADYHRFTEEMLRQGVEFAAAAERTGHPVSVALNLGSMSFMDRGLPARVEGLLDAHGVPPERLTLEVTESDLLDESGADAPVFEELLALGVRLSIDDFGTGYSNLTRLRTLSVHELKVDRAFVWGLGGSAEDAIIVKAIIDLAYLLGHSVVAEGVETVTQMQTLQRFGCEYAQGYLFDRPLDQATLLGLLAEGHRYDVGIAKTTQVDVGIELGKGIDMLAERTTPRVESALDGLYRRLEAEHGSGVAVLVRDRAGRLVAGNEMVKGFFGKRMYDRMIGTRDEDFATGPREGTFSVFGTVVASSDDAPPPEDGVWRSFDVLIDGETSQRVATIARPLRDREHRLVGKALVFVMGDPEAAQQAFRAAVTSE